MNLFEQVQPLKKENSSAPAPSVIDKKLNKNLNNNFSNYKNNLFSLYLKCNKFIAQKPYFNFSQEKNLFLSNDHFNDFFDLKNKKIILNIDDFEVISYIVRSFLTELNSKNIKFIFNFGRLIPLDYFYNIEFKKNKFKRCHLCPFYDLKNQKCLLN